MRRGLNPLSSQPHTQLLESQSAQSQRDAMSVIFAVLVPWPRNDCTHMRQSMYGLRGYRTETELAVNHDML